MRRTALITGASRGIGAACARRLAATHHPILTARTTDSLASMREQLPDASFISADLGTDAGVDGLLQELADRSIRVDVLVNNAGIAISAPLRGHSDEDLDQLLAVNLRAPFRLIRALAPAMASAGYGRIINIASTSAIKGYRYTAAYSASKAGLVGLTRALAVEFAGKGLCINAVCPTFTDTDIVGEATRKIAERTGRAAEDARASIAAFSPQDRLLDPDEVAALVAYLASDDARGINGQALTIDGGETA